MSAEMRRETDDSKEDGRPIISWGSVPPNPVIETRIAAAARRMREIDARITCRIGLDEVHEFGRRGGTYSAEVVLVPHEGEPIVSRYEASPGAESHQLAHAISKAFGAARRQLLDRKDRLVSRRNDAGHGHGIGER